MRQSKRGEPLADFPAPKDAANLSVNERMKHPVSHTAVVLAGSCVLVLWGMFLRTVGDRNATRSESWWYIVGIATFLLATALVAVFRPFGKAGLVVIVAGSLSLLAIASAGAWMAIDTDDPTEKSRIPYRVGGLAIMWCTWNACQFGAWRRDRRNRATRHLARQ